MKPHAMEITLAEVYDVNGASGVRKGSIRAHLSGRSLCRGESEREGLGS